MKRIRASLLANFEAGGVTGTAFGAKRSLRLEALGRDNVLKAGSSTKGESVAMQNVCSPRDDALLVGQFVKLVALNLDEHAGHLFAASHGMERDELWRFLRDGPFRDASDHKAHLLSLCASKQFSGFVIVDASSSVLLGQVALMKASEEHRTVEIGYVLFFPALQRTRGGTEALYLMMRYAFEKLRVRRCEWRCDSQNVKSERAAHRLGFQREGVLRQHMMVKGRSRDTIVFSLLDFEWRNVKVAIENWLSDENFDESGVAIQSLDSLLNCPHNAPQLDVAAAWGAAGSSNGRAR